VEATAAASYSERACVIHQVHTTAAVTAAIIHTESELKYVTYVNCVYHYDDCAGELSAVVSKYDDSMLGLAQAMQTLRQKMKEVFASHSIL
jgi:hypothetical protein